uniref:Uncharacterized protein n=1 Tax=Timema douglasi TaxID=61478 RepID=A0A7R8VJ60_TIMDO|nr:unnamed protein product [Timema douglasi]
MEPPLKKKESFEERTDSIEWKRRDACEKHIKNKGHIKQVQASLTTGVKRQLSIEGAIQAQKKAKDDKVEFIMDTTEMFLKANIPIEKLDNPVVRSWMGKYIKGSGDLPSASWLRREYVPKCGALAKENIKVSLANKSVAIFCDETTDRRRTSELISNATNTGGHNVSGVGLTVASQKKPRKI